MFSVDFFIIVRRRLNSLNDALSLMLEYFHNKKRVGCRGQIKINKSIDKRDVDLTEQANRASNVEFTKSGEVLYLKCLTKS